MEAIARVLIVGGDGAIAAALAAALTNRSHVVMGTSRRGTAGALRLDLAGPIPGDLPAVDVCFLCAALSRQRECARDPERAWQVNVASPAAIVEQIAARGGRTVLLSSSAVFDGRRAARRADEPPCPVNPYGRQKAAAEAIVLASLGGAVVRLTKVVSAHDPLFVEWLAALRGHDAIHAFNDLYLSPLALKDVVDALIFVAELGTTGIVQLSGPRDISYVQVARHFADRLGVDRARVIAASAATAGIPAEDRPPHTTLAAASGEALLGRPFGEPDLVFDRVFGLGVGGTPSV